MRVLYTDGGSIGNGRVDQRARMAVFDAELGRIVVDADLGALTNNEAEYRAIEAALDYAETERLGPAELRSDSQLCVHQIRGEWKVKEPRLLPSVERARSKLAANRGRITWVPREQNLAGRFLEGLEPVASAASGAAPTAAGPAGPGPTAAVAAGGAPGLAAEARPYCQRCGARTVERLVDHRPRPRCPRCGWTQFLDPKVAVAAAIELEGGLLLCRRAIEPGLGKWSFPAGFVDRGEELRAALAREVREETGLEAEVGGLVGVYSEPGNPVILIVFDV